MPLRYKRVVQLSTHEKCRQEVVLTTNIVDLLF